MSKIVTLAEAKSRDPLDGGSAQRAIYSIPYPGVSAQGGLIGLWRPALSIKTKQATSNN
jgi:hypothetical protein